ncbi:MAG: AAA family ATPase [Candidatus Thiodiazotropha sp. (ex. Lucinisca nassula)]|nr:AAA family ATPase [Candidatus Thiodiazotropha sp. (ex. Lucinisca nassula)]MBW9271221.1 AAA family ATPase [Candidatus Thiodiazotropha sp. (ex. Lucinisca nassula)]
MSDNNEFFSTPEVTAHLDLIRHLIENSELVPLVRGAEGSGKSLLASRLQQMAPENWMVCHFSAEPTLQPERLLAFIARCSGLPDIAGNLMQRLADRFEVLRKRGSTPVLLVDDAQMLPPTSLMTLLRLFERQVEGDRLVSIVLFADEQIDLLLSTPQLQVMTPQSIQAIDMPVLTRAEATEYMAHLLKNEGLSDNFALDESKLNRLYKETGGVPGPLASAILGEVGIQGEAKPEALSGYRKQLLMIGVPVVSVILLLLLFQGPINSLFGPAVEPQAEPMASQSEKEEIVLPPPDAVAQNLVPNESRPEESNESADLAAMTPAMDDQPIVDTAKPSLAEVTQSELAGQSQEQVTTVDPVSADYPTDVEEPEAEAAVEQQAVADVAESEKPAEMVVEAVETITSPDAALSEPVSLPDRAPVVEEAVAGLTTDSPPAEIAVADTPVETEPVKPVEPPAEVASLEEVAAEPAEDVVSAPETKAETDPFAESAAWVQSQPGENYTLQLIAVENLASLNRYISRNSLDNQVVTVKTLRKGAPWYALIWGSFANRDLALAAQGDLPAAVRKGGVWARSFASLQNLP